MDYQVAFNLVVGLAAAFGGWTLRSITHSLENLQKDHKEMMNQFVRRDTLYIRSLKVRRLI